VINSGARAESSLAHGKVDTFPSEARGGSQLNRNPVQVSVDSAQITSPPALFFKVGDGSVFITFVSYSFLLCSLTQLEDGTPRKMYLGSITE
jgi:hypothetical protein